MSARRPADARRAGPGGDRLQRRLLLGRHVAGRAAQPRAAAAGYDRAGRARWKSSSIGWPSAASSTLDGLRSRWTRPRSWAYCRRSARQAPIQQTAWTYDDAGQEPRRRPLDRQRGRAARPGSRACASQEVLPVRRCRRRGPQAASSRSSVVPAEIGHAQGPQAGGRRSSCTEYSGTMCVCCSRARADVLAGPWR